jgi:hypothetical protein
MTIDTYWLPIIGGICASGGITHILYSASFYCREDPKILPGIALIVGGAAMVVAGLLPGLATVAGVAASGFGILVISFAVFMVGGFFGCSSDHEGRDFAVRLVIGVALVLVGWYLLGAFDAPTAATTIPCHWENTTVADVWICPKP